MTLQDTVSLMLRHYLLKLEQRAKIEGIDLTEGGGDNDV